MAPPHDLDGHEGLRDLLFSQFGNLLSLYGLMTRTLPTYQPVPVPTV
jgi:hypothetical protein